MGFVLVVIIEPDLLVFPVEKKRKDSMAFA